MSGSVDILNPDKPKRVVIIASNPAVSKQTGWPIGFWWAELTHPYWELTERGYQVDIAFLMEFIGQIIFLSIELDQITRDCLRRFNNDSRSPKL